MMATSPLALQDNPDSPRMSIMNNHAAAQHDVEAVGGGDLYSHIRESRLEKGDGDENYYSKRISIPYAVVSGIPAQNY
jgi:hypothetical protein